MRGGRSHLGLVALLLGCARPADVAGRPGDMPPAAPGPLVAEAPCLGPASTPVASLPDATDVPAMRELAGAYYSGDGLGRNTTLTIGADGRFSFVWHGCMGKYDETRGTVRLEGGRVRLTLENAPAMAWDRWEGLGDDLWTVPWGPRLYLVPDKGLAGFVDQIHGRWEPRDSAYGPYYLRREDWEKPVSGTPTLPGEWSQRILDHPVPGQVTEALNDGRWRVDIGRRAGAFVGMGLVSPRHSPLFPHLRIVEVNDDSSVVELYGPGDAAPRVGNKVLGGRSR